MTAASFTLFVSGASPTTQRCVDAALGLCRKAHGDEFELRIVDVIDDPGRAEEARVIATPTFIRHVPLPEVRLVGDLSDSAEAISLIAAPHPSPDEHAIGGIS